MTRRRRLGQHFLIDGSVAREVSEALPAQPARVLEIGPGKGALTRELLARFPRVVALELDGALAARVSPQLGSPLGLTVVQGDALDVDLEELLGGGPWLAAGNLPYSVATPIVRRILGTPGLFPAAVFMVQEEVARRLVARPGDRARGLLTVEVECGAVVEYLRQVGPRCFAPPPKVVSAVVRLTARPSPHPPEMLRAAVALASVAFQHRRKKIANAVEGKVAREAIVAALERTGVDANRRAEDLTLENWVDLASALRETGGVR